METEQDDRVEEHHLLNNGGFCVKLISDEGNDDEGTSKATRMPSYIGAFTSSNNKRTMNKSTFLLDATKYHRVCDQETYSLRRNFWDNPKKDYFVGKELGQGEKRNAVVVVYFILCF